MGCKRALKPAVISSVSHWKKGSLLKWKVPTTRSPIEREKSHRNDSMCEIFVEPQESINENLENNREDQPVEDLQNIMCDIRIGNERLHEQQRMQS